MNYNLIIEKITSKLFRLEVLIGDEPILTKELSLSSNYNIISFSDNNYPFDVRLLDNFIISLSNNYSSILHFNQNNDDDSFIYNSNINRFIINLSYNRSCMTLSIELNDLSRKQFVVELTKLSEYIKDCIQEL